MRDPDRTSWPWPSIYFPVLLKHELQCGLDLFIYLFIFPEIGPCVKKTSVPEDNFEVMEIRQNMIRPENGVTCARYV